MKNIAIWVVVFCGVMPLVGQAQETAAEPEKKKVQIELKVGEKLGIAGGEEFSASVGTASVVEIEGKKFVQVDYDLTDGVYMSAGFPLELKRAFKTLTFEARSDEACGFGVRLIDKNGECFQFKFDNKNPGKKQELEADLNQEKIECWGGDANHVIDQPVKAIHFVVSKREVPVKGTAFFSEIIFKR